ncbi:MAG: multidrug ABC transporter ATP-binding protein [Treponema sp.]|nr:MAG: multidrug ABC transporter ATP-binding protein [Treponema sp.]
MSLILETKDLTKKYFGKLALNKLNVQIGSGKIVGFLGPNGSGKTTFLKLIAGLLQPSSGSFTVCDKPFGIETKKLVSFLPDRNTLYPWMKAIDAINFYQDFFPDFDKKKALDMLTFMKLSEQQKISEMSKGMLEKMNLTLSFSRKAKLFILDEPIGGTDPVAREQIIKTVIGTWAEDCTLLITTHLVKDIEAVFTDVYFLNEGEIVLSGDAEELRAERGQSIYKTYLEVFG